MLKHLPAMPGDGGSTSDGAVDGSYGQDAAIPPLRAAARQILNKSRVLWRQNCSIRIQIRAAPANNYLIPFNCLYLLPEFFCPRTGSRCFGAHMLYRPAVGAVTFIVCKFPPAEEQPS